MDYIVQIGYWSILPGLGTSVLQTLLYRFITPPANGSIEYHRHKKYCFIAVILGYLIYSMVEAELEMPSNYYQLLNHYPNADEKSLKSSFRRLSILYHPDKIQQADAGAPQMYLPIRDAYDVLKDPMKRYAYGTSSVGCEKCRTFQDYMKEHINSIVTFYAATVSTGIALSIVGTISEGLYWRFVSLCALGIIELYLIVTPGDPLAYVIPWRTTAEKIALLRHFFMIISIALSQIGPSLFPEDNRDTRTLILELEESIIEDQETSKSLLINSFIPFKADGKGYGSLKTRLEKQRIECTLENDPEFIKAFEEYRKTK